MTSYQNRRPPQATERQDRALPRQIPVRRLDTMPRPSFSNNPLGGRGVGRPAALHPPTGRAQTRYAVMPAKYLPRLPDGTINSSLTRPIIAFPYPRTEGDEPAQDILEVPLRNSLAAWQRARRAEQLSCTVDAWQQEVKRFLPAPEMQKVSSEQLSIAMQRQTRERQGGVAPTEMRRVDPDYSFRALQAGGRGAQHGVQGNSSGWPKNGGRNGGGQASGGVSNRTGVEWTRTL